ncbi:hypothetical protein [Paenibacillus sp. GXUN7292]
MKQQNKIIVRGHSAKEMQNEIRTPNMTKAQFDMYKKAIEVNRQVKKKHK